MSTEANTVDMLQTVRAVYYTTTGEDFYPNAYAESLTKVSAEDAVAGALKRVKAAGSTESPMLNQNVPLLLYDQLTSDNFDYYRSFTSA